jgi:hypothetical protein
MGVATQASKENTTHLALTAHERNELASHSERT